MENKLKGVMLYLDHREAIHHLTDEEAGKIFKGLYDYISDGTLPDLSGSMMSLFCMYQIQINHSAEQYTKRCEINQKNALKRYQKRVSLKNNGKQEDTIPCENKQTDTINNNNMQSHTDASLYSNNYNNNTNNNVNNTDIIEVSSNENDISFEEIWELYDKKIGNIAILSQMWNKLSINDKQSVSYYIPLYKAARPNPKYRKNFFNFITCRTWETESINSIYEPTTNRQTSETVSERKSTARNEAEGAVQILLNAEQ